MQYFKEYGITKEQIEEIRDRYNENIIQFLKTESEFIIEKLEYLKNNNMIIYPILKNNIKIFLETIIPLEIKMKKMKKMGYSNKMMQITLMEEKLYDVI